MIFLIDSPHSKLPTVLYLRKKLEKYMNLHEYQAKQLLKKFNVPVQEGIACNTPGEAEEACKQIHTQYGSNYAVVKAQIHAGGRGKGKIVGKEQKGVAVGKNAEDVKQIAQNILGALWSPCKLDLPEKL
jgi:succinyl-CoA synthetase beta subunit